MGGYGPPEFWTDELAETVRVRIMEPTVRALAQEGCPYTGVLYGGLMVTRDGPKVIEFNCRLGDPEAQVLLPRLKTDLLDLCLAVLEGRLHEVAVEWSSEACVGVVMASQGYPGDYPRGLPITGLEKVDKDVVVFHAGTKLADAGQVVTDGGRVLTVTAMGATLEEARQRVYRNVGLISFEGAHYRKDIAALMQVTI
jgi:phosphoribosylamine--glycine ligase